MPDFNTGTKRTGRTVFHPLEFICSSNDSTTSSSDNPSSTEIKSACTTSSILVGSFPVLAEYFLKSASVTTPVARPSRLTAIAYPEPSRGVTTCVMTSKSRSMGSSS